MNVAKLIEKAAQLHGGYRGLSRLTGIPDSHLHNYRKGKSCPIHVLAKLYEAAGEDWKGPVLAAVAQRMGKLAKDATALGVAAMLAYGLTGGAQPAYAHGDRDNV